MPADQDRDERDERAGIPGATVAIVRGRVLRAPAVHPDEVVALGAADVFTTTAYARNPHVGARGSAKPCSGRWHEAQLTVLSTESRVSKNSLRPSAARVSSRASAVVLGGVVLLEHVEAGADRRQRVPQLV